MRSRPKLLIVTQNPHDRSLVAELVPESREPAFTNYLSGTAVSEVDDGEIHTLHAHRNATVHPIDARKRTISRAERICDMHVSRSRVDVT
jgi:hypothetical protein